LPGKGIKDYLVVASSGDEGSGTIFLWNDEHGGSPHQCPIKHFTNGVIHRCHAPVEVLEK